MKISELGEEQIITRLIKTFNADTPKNVLGIGDDCAVIPVSKNLSQVITTDALIEDVHFIKDKISPFDLGFKSLAVNLSDIAAMGAKAKYVFLTLALPQQTEVQWLEDFLAGLKVLLTQTNVTLLGGDTVRTPYRIMISITALGEAEPAKIKYRHTGKQDDIICVTGALGDSAAGLQCVLKNLEINPDTQALIDRHYRPEPHLNEGHFLAASKAVTAMMDLSDGLNSDLKKLMTASKVGAEVHLEKFPLSRELKTVASKNNWNATDMAAIGGEDYCLLVCVEAKDFSLLQEQYQSTFKKPLYPIGHLTDSSQGLAFKLNGHIIELSGKGFEHF